MLKIGDADETSLRVAIVEICSADAADGLAFDLDSLQFAPIREETEYGGTRVVLMTRLGSARLKFQIDIGVGDAITPDPESQQFPSLLGMDAPRIKCYPIETVIAEKLEAIVSRGADNSRIKDFFDLAFICDTFELDGSIVMQAIQRTFTRRGTPIPSDVPYALTGAFYDGERQTRQWSAFVVKSRLPNSSSFPDMCRAIKQFCQPMFEALTLNEHFLLRWADRSWKRPNEPV